MCSESRPHGAAGKDTRRRRYDYVWNSTAYARLVEIVSTNTSYVVLREFCDRVFEAEGREVSSVTDREVRILRNTPFPRGDRQ